MNKKSKNKGLLKKPKQVQIARGGNGNQKSIIILIHMKSPSRIGICGLHYHPQQSELVLDFALKIQIFYLPNLLTFLSNHLCICQFINFQKIEANVC